MLLSYTIVVFYLLLLGCWYANMCPFDKSLILRWPLRPVVLLFTYTSIYCVECDMISETEIFSEILSVGYASSCLSKDASLSSKFLKNLFLFNEKALQHMHGRVPFGRHIKSLYPNVLSLRSSFWFFMENRCFPTGFIKAPYQCL